METIHISLIILTDFKYGLNQIMFHYIYSFNWCYIIIFLEDSGSKFLRVKVSNHRQSVFIFALRNVKRKGAFSGHVRDWTT